jgi:UDP-2,4-diacetamido-2,4,6-trideoxy-beta-L-altropyranose hydrolase
MTLSAKTLTVVPNATPSRQFLWVRTTAGPQIGFGHLKRCFSLAQALQDSFSPVFILDREDSGIGAQVAKMGWKYYCRELDALFESMPDPAGILIDTRVTAGLDGFIAKAKSRGIPVISIHDLGLAPLASDIAVDGSVVAPSGDPFPHSGRRFGGTEYMVLDPVYGRLRERPKPIRERIHSVFVNLGGGDSAKYFSGVLEGLKRWSHALDVVGVPGFVSWGQETIGRREWYPLHFHWETEGLEGLLFQADLAITAGGLSAYEALCAGTPLAALSYDPPQQTTIAALTGKGACVDLGPGDALDPFQVSATLSLIDTDIDRRRSLSIHGREIVDGRGVDRVAQLVRQEILNRYAADHGRSNGSSTGL